MTEVTSISVEILQGLAQLHAVNILHLDLKPANILLDEYGHSYLADFGISCALATLQACSVVNNLAGTPHYMQAWQYTCFSRDVKACWSALSIFVVF